MANVQPRPKIASGPKNEVYDVIVVGGQLGGALSAALLAKRKYRVLLVEHDGVGHGYEHGGYLLPYSPFLAPPLKAMPEVEEAFNELGITTTLQRAFKAHAPSLQLVLPNHRVDLHAEEPKRLRELKREYPESADAVDSGLKEAAQQHERSDAFFKLMPNLPPDGFFEKWSLGSQIKSVPGLQEASAISGNDAASTLLRKLSGFLHFGAAADSNLASTRPLSQVLKNPHKFPGGREGLRELLLKRLQELGGDVLGLEPSENSVVEELSFDGSKLVGIKLVRGETIYRASVIVAATDAGALRRLVQDKKRQRKLSEELDLASTKELLFSVNWVVPVDALPLGMGDLLLVETEDPELSPILVQVLPARKVGGKEGKSDDESARTVCAAAFVPASARELGEAHLEQLGRKLDERLDELLPFAKDRALVRSAPYLDAGGVRGSRLQPHPHVEVNSEQFLGVTGLRQRTAVKNLILASREVLPGLGLEGEFLAGIRSAKLVQESLKKKDPLKR
ncbi:MAG: NAD(P)-binding protein [Myxococcaceae bacterium]